MTTFIKVRLINEHWLLNNICIWEGYHTIYHRISYQSKNLIYYVIKELKPRLIDVKIIAFFRVAMLSQILSLTSMDNFN